MRIAITSALLLVVSIKAGAQPAYNDFSGPTPPSQWWVASITTLQPLPSGSGKGIAISVNDSARLLNQMNPRELSFDASAAGGTPLQVSVGRSCQAGPYITVLDTAIAATTQAQTHRIRVGAEEIGLCAFQWTTRSDGRVLLSSVQVLSLDSTGIAELENRKRILADAIRELENRTVSAARVDLDSAGKRLRRVGPDLARWATEARTIAALDDFAGAVKARGDLSNPLKYDAFTRLRDSVLAFTSPVAQEHLKESATPVETLFKTVGNIASGNILGLVNDFRQIGPSVRALTGTVRDLLSTGINLTKVRRQFNFNEQNAEKYLVSLYTRSSPLLTALQAEADSFSSHMSQLEVLQQRQAELIGRTENQLVLIFRYARLPGTSETVQAYRLSVNQTSGTTAAPQIQLDSAIQHRVQTRISATSLPIINEEQREINLLLQGFTDILAMRTQLDLDRLAFLNRQVTYLCSLPDPPGETDLATLTLFANRTREAATLMRRAAYGFQVARFGRPPLGDRTLRECRRAPELERNEPPLPTIESGR